MVFLFESYQKPLIQLHVYQNIDKVIKLSACIYMLLRLDLFTVVSAVRSDGQLTLMTYKNVAY